jgi:DNA-binding transcriptional LysR family regulator
MRVSLGGSHSHGPDATISPGGRFVLRRVRCGESRFLPRILIGNFTAAKNIVFAGQGIGAALPFQLKREIDDGDCVLLPLELPWLRLNCGFISKRGRTHSPAAKAFMDNVRRLEKELPA